MRIEIRERLRPFSHCPGVRLCLPGTALAIRAFPTRVELYTLAEERERLLDTLDLPHRGPVKGFTVQQDLERGGVRLFGTTPDGYRRYSIEAKEERLDVTCAKKAAALVTWPERLSLGSHKAQDWQLVCRRQDIKEFLPIWFRLGLTIPSLSVAEDAPSLLGRCAELIARRQCDQIRESFVSLFQAGFLDLCFPTLTDSLCQGFDIPPLVASSPLALLTEGATLIRSLFFQEREGALHLLPALPPEAFAGRLLNTPFSLGTLDIEWTKKKIRRAILRPSASGKIRLKTHRDTRSMRLRRTEREPGLFLDPESPFEVSVGEALLLDRFEK